MADFPVCPSSESTMSVLPPFCRGAVKTGRFYRKVVSANLFADTLPKSKDCTAQSLSRFATAPFTQGSPCRVPFSTRVPFGKQLCKYQFVHPAKPLSILENYFPVSSGFSVISPARLLPNSSLIASGSIPWPRAHMSFVMAASVVMSRPWMTPRSRSWFPT